jgi:hypothetical protein
MRKGTLADQCDWFKLKLDSLEAQANQLLGDASTDEGKRWIAKMMAVEAWSLFSQFCEWVLYCSVNNDSEQLRKTTGLAGIPQHLNLDTVTALFTLDRGYFDFRSYGELIAFGKRYISEDDAKNPFKKPNPDDTKKIDQLAKIRNRVVHESPKSRKAYDVMMRADYNYERVPAPGNFLAAAGDGKIHLFEFFDALRRVAAVIKA